MIAALEKLRQKYPVYNKVSDEQLAAGLAKKYPKAYGFLPEQVAKEKAVSGYEPMSRESALMAEDRPNMWKALGQEVAYSPLTNDKLTTGQKVRQTMLHGPTAALKALGAAGQSIEGAASAPVVAWQRGLRPVGKTAGEYWKTVGKSAIGESPTEIGDITRNIGAPEWESRALGLAGSMALPGIGKVANTLAAPVRKAVEKATGKTLNIGGKAIARTQLSLLARAEPEAVEYGMKVGFKPVTRSMTKETIERNVGNASNRLERVTKIVQRKASKAFEEGLDKHNDELVHLVLPSGESAITSNAKNGLVREGLIRLKNVAAEEEEEVLKYAATNSGLTGLGNVIKSINELDDLGKITVRDLRASKHILRKVTESQSSVGAAKAAAYAMLNDIDNLIGKQVPGMDKVNANYKYWKRFTDPLSTLSKTTDKLGAAGTDKYWKLNRLQKDLINGFDSALKADPTMKHLKFADKMKDAALQNTFKKFIPTLGASLAASGTAGVKVLAGQPMLAAGLVGAGLAVSPRLGGLFHKKLSSIRNLADKPMFKTIHDLVGKGIIDPALLRATREKALYPSMNEE